MELCIKSSNFNKKKLRKSIVIIIAAYVIFLLISFGIYQYQSIFSSEKILSENIPAEKPIGEIISETQILQTIPVNTNITEIELLAATYARENAGSLEIRVVGAQSGLQYADFLINVAQMQDNSYVSIPLEELATRDKDSLINVLITSNSVSGSAVTFWQSSQDIVPNASLTLNGEQVRKRLITTRL